MKPSPYLFVLCIPNYLVFYCGMSVFTARVYAKRGICRLRVSVCVSVCLCVCHTPVLYQNG